MRLIEAKTLVVKEFFTNIPPYAILSHTWGDGEVSFQHMQDLDVASKLQGFRKIRGSADLAIANGHDWIWVDTCCIDKTSSAELSEAINSMFAWYRDSEICYVYLSDVHGITDAMLRDFYTDGPRKLYVRNLIASSRWFTRGWTLQELVAPGNIEFFTAEWNSLGTKHALEALLSEKTGIPRAVLAGGLLSEYSAAEKLSWAARRVTTREEDAAYCLLGIFDVHMPLLYGESTSAFVRLQEEIFKRTEDLSLLVWTNSTILSRATRRSALARHPSAFEGPVLNEAFLDTTTDAPTRATRFMFPVRRGKLAPLQLQQQQMRHPPPVMTNRGLLATIWLSPLYSPRVTPHSVSDPPPIGVKDTQPPKKYQTLFACGFSAAILDITDQKMNRHQAMCLIGLTLDTEIELATETGEDGQIRTLSLRETLLKDSRPFVAWRSRTGDLVCMEMTDDIVSSLIPHQVYLSTNNPPRQQPLPSAISRADAERAHQERMAWRSRIDGGAIHVQVSAPGTRHILHHAVQSNGQGLSTFSNSADLCWITLTATPDPTVVTMSFNRRLLPNGITHLGTIPLRVSCQRKDNTEETTTMSAAPARHETSVHETSVAVELGLADVAYHFGIQQLRCALILASPGAVSGSSAEVEYKDQPQVSLECGHVLRVAVRGIWGNMEVMESEKYEQNRWHVRPSLDIRVS